MALDEIQKQNTSVGFQNSSGCEMSIENEWEFYYPKKKYYLLYLTFKFKTKTGFHYFGILDQRGVLQIRFINYAILSKFIHDF